MKVLKFLTFFLLFFNIFLLFIPSVEAVDLKDQVMGQLGAGAAKAELGNPQAPQQIMAEIIKVFLGLVGTIFIILIVMSGYWLLTARGEEEKIKKAQTTIKRAVIGLFIIILSYALVSFIATRIQQAALL